MEYTIAVADREFQVKSKFMRTVDRFPNTKETEHDGPHNQFLITIKHNGITRRFSFYDSTANYQIDLQICPGGRKELGETALTSAFGCFFDDAIYGTYSFTDFCNELGYDDDSRTAERIYKLCKKSLAKAHDLGLDDDDLFTIVNELNERS